MATRTRDTLLCMLLSLLSLRVWALSQRQHAVNFADTCNCQRDTQFCHGAMEHHQYFRCLDNSCAQDNNYNNHNTPYIGESDSESVEGVVDVGCECLRERCESAYDMYSQFLNESCLEDCESWVRDNECADLTSDRYQCSTLFYGHCFYLFIYLSIY